MLLLTMTIPLQVPEAFHHGACSFRLACHLLCLCLTLGAVLPMHLSQHRAQKLCPGLRMIADADDTYVGGPKETLYDDYETLKSCAERDCDHIDWNYAGAVEPVDDGLDVDMDLIRRARALRGASQLARTESK